MSPSHLLGRISNWYSFFEVKKASYFLIRTVFLGNMTENKEMGPKEVKNSQKKKLWFFWGFFYFEIFLIANVFQIYIWIIESINQWINEKGKMNLTIVFQRLKNCENLQKKGTFDFSNPRFTSLYHKNSSNRTDFY